MSVNVSQQIMKDRWINVGHDEEELKPYTEPEPDFSDTKRIGLDLYIILMHFFLIMVQIKILCLYHALHGQKYVHLCRDHIE